MTRVPLTLVVVDDDPLDIELLRRYVRDVHDWDVTLVPFAGWREAQADLQVIGPHVLMVDFLMGAQTGLEIITELREAGDTRPVVLLTGAGDERLAAEAMRLGADDYLNKNLLSPASLSRSILAATSMAELRRERAAAEERLRSSERKYRKLMDRLSEGVALIHAQGTFTFWNPRLFQMLGYQPEDLDGLTLQDLAPPDQWDLFQAKFLNPAQGPSDQFETQLRRKDGRLLDVFVSTGPFVGQGGEPRTLALFTNESRRKRTDEALRRAQKQESLALMAGSIAHDFNNLFQSVQGHLELAERRLGEPERVRTSLGKALASLSKASQLSSRMLDYSGRGFHRLARWDACALVHGHQDSLEDLTSEKVVVRLCPAGEHRPYIDCDPDQVLQVLSALVVNGTEAMGGAPGTIEIGAVQGHSQDMDPMEGYWALPCPEGPVVVISVRDTGSGMEAHLLPRLFDPFFTTKELGRGLGLAAAVGILQGHHAGLQVLSAPGEGSMFRLYFPASLSEAGGAAPAGRTAPALLPSQPRGVLVVDDDADLRLSLVEVLTEVLQRPCFQACDGVEAVAVFEAHQEEIALVITDATMPRMGGWEAFEAINRIRPGTRAILCSGYSEEDGRGVARAHGFASFLQKPFSIQTLTEALEAALQG